MEIKGVTEDFSGRGSIAPWTPDGIQYTMEKIETIFEDCDAELTNAEMPTLGYEKQPISTMIEHMVILVRYVSSAHPQCYSELDHPLYVGFKNGAAETLSNIILEDITTDNTFEMQKYEEIIDVNGHYYRSSTKKSLTMSDFLGLDAVIPGKGMPVVENVETIGWFTDLFRIDYEKMGASVESLDQMLEAYLHGGEYSHKEHHPIGNLVSGIFDVTIVKPFIESIYGYDLITGEKLTDFEREMQLVNAVVGAVTFGQGALAIDFAEMTGTEVAAVLLKTWAVDAVADVSAYTVGYACDELGMPAGVTFLASLATGCTVSVKAGRYVFTDSSGKIVKELDADGMQTLLKELDVDLDDMTWGEGKSNIGEKIGYEYLDGQLGDLKGKVKVNQYQSAENVNDWWENRGYKLPYKEKTVVQNITLIEDTKFVRVYDNIHSRLEGGWIMKAEDIQGLTAKEIQIKYALEYEPVYIGEVQLKVGDTIRLGEVGPNFGFDGGGIQIDLQQQYIGDFIEIGKIEDWGIK